MPNARIIKFSNKAKIQTKHRRGKKLLNINYSTEQQIKLLRRVLRNAATLAKINNNITTTREWMLIDLLINSDIRETEISNLRCGDIKIDHDQSEIFIRNSKGAKSRTVEIPVSLKTHIKSFLHWKENRGEPTGSDDYLFIVGQKRHITTAAVRQCIKKWVKKLCKQGKPTRSAKYTHTRTVQNQSGHNHIDHISLSEIIV